MTKRDIANIKRYDQKRLFSGRPITKWLKDIKGYVQMKYKMIWLDEIIWWFGGWWDRQNDLTT